MAAISVEELLADPRLEEVGLLLTRALLAREARDDERALALRDAVYAQGAELCSDRKLLTQALRTRTQELRSLLYPEYLRTPHWQQMRRFALERALHMCAICSAETSLQVHHRTYADRGDELLVDLTVLCADCHKLFHQHRRIER